MLKMSEHARPLDWIKPLCTHVGYSLANSVLIAIGTCEDVKITRRVAKRLAKLADNQDALTPTEISKP